MSASFSRNTETSQILLSREKHRLLAGEHVDTSVVRPVILNSWKRSLSYHVSSENATSEQVEPAALQQLLSRNRFLIQCVENTFRQMFSDNEDMFSSMVLADRDGIILSAIHSRQSTYRPHPDTRIGSISREEVIGTNGIGTCLVEKIPLEILGFEHFRNISTDTSCSAAPIFDEQNNLIAVLNVSQPRNAYHIHTLGMVRAAVCAISGQLRQHCMLQGMEAIIGLLQDGIMLVSRNGTIRLMNDTAAHIAGLQEPVDNCPLSSVLQDEEQSRLVAGQKLPLRDKEMLLKFRSPVHCIFSVLPLDNDREVLFTLRKARQVRKYAMQVTGSNRAEFELDSIIGTSRAVQRARSMARRIAAHKTTVLLLGESGTGKELFAQAIHNASPIASGPFVTVNCGALPRSLLESELFGYMEGAFTGARRQGNPGKFELADKGTIFLDEIGEIPLDAQAALLRVLQNNEVTRIGATCSRKIDVRVIAATNRNLEKMVAEGSFREDLFYRLNVFPIAIPALREREGDIRELAEYFFVRMSKSLGKTYLGMTDDVVAALEAYSWPGNIRELENSIERAITLTEDGLIDCHVLPEKLQRSLLGLAPAAPAAREPASARASRNLYLSAPASEQAFPRAERTAAESMQASIPQTAVPETGLTGYRTAQETVLIRTTLLKNKCNMRRTAMQLGISRPYLYQKMKKLGLDVTSLRRELEAV